MTKPQIDLAAIERDVDPRDYVTMVNTSALLALVALARAAVVWSNWYGEAHETVVPMARPVRELRAACAPFMAREEA